ncbi:MAG: VWA domain-containing protein [Pyrinomonadaceae bacterium]
MQAFRFFFFLTALAAMALTFSFSDPSVAVEAQTTASPTPPTIGTPPPLIIDSGEVIKIDTELVNLNVRVVDRLNRPISNLSKEDFSIFEDNERQSIEFFSFSEVPTNYTLVVDNSGSMREQIEQVIEAGKTLIGTNRADDETSIIRFINSQNIEILEDFTSDREELFDALDNMYIDGGRTAVIDAIYLAADSVSEYEKVRNDTKRRALILVSDGEDRESTYDEKQLFELLRETNVQIYAIGFVDQLDSEGGFIKKSPQKKAVSFLKRLAEETGGKVYFPKSVNELQGIAEDIAKEMRTQYSIGYIPTNDRKDGTYRNIKVSVKDGANKEKRIAITKTGRIAEASSKLK